MRLFEWWVYVFCGAIVGVAVYVITGLALDCSKQKYVVTLEEIKNQNKEKNNKC
jgi:hypothetical protein